MTMVTSPTGRDVLVAREALRTKAYQDSRGTWTIGVGHTSMAGPPQVTPDLVLSREDCLTLFSKDLLKYETPVNQAVKVALDDHEFDALVSMCYNIGPAWFLGARQGTFMKLLNKGDKKGCAAAMLAYSKPPEILSRRRGEQYQFLMPYNVRMPSARIDAHGHPI